MMPRLVLRAPFAAALSLLLAACSSAPSAASDDKICL